MFVVDTNILVYAADRDAVGHDRCRAMLEQWRQQASPWYLCWNVIYEFLRVTTHPRVFRKPLTASDSWGFITSILASRGVGILSEGEGHPETVTEIVAALPHLSGNLVHNAHVAALMREHGVRVIYTHDMDFHRFRGLDVRDPLA